MSTTIIIIIVACCGVALFISFFAFVSISNKKRAKKLQENLKKLKKTDEEEKKEEESIKINTDIQGENVSEDEIFGNETVFSDGGFFVSKKNEENLQNKPTFDRAMPPLNNDVNRFEDDMPRMPRRPSYRQEQQKRRDRDADFEQFLDEHAFSRKVFDKNLLKKIQKLPPEIKTIIMGNVFDKFNDDDK